MKDQLRREYRVVWLLFAAFVVIGSTAAGAGSVGWTLGAGIPLLMAFGRIGEIRVMRDVYRNELYREMARQDMRGTR